MEQLNGLDLLAQEAGIQPGFHDNRGVFHQVSDETQKKPYCKNGHDEEAVSPESVLTDLRDKESTESSPAGAGSF